LIPLIDHANIACGFHAGYLHDTPYRPLPVLTHAATH
jgi:hypothetical protein